jgi:hypothetical protein
MQVGGGFSAASRIDFREAMWDKTEETVGHLITENLHQLTSLKMLNRVAGLSIGAGLVGSAINESLYVGMVPHLRPVDFF